ncbi:MAG TPA: cell division protein FtsQ/DivIB [Steroidobacteraceae bacterium]|nr:cell division protein FtsQ/DivIB [Steroidobacteraceae bacterium]
MAKRRRNRRSGTGMVRLALSPQVRRMLLRLTGAVCALVLVLVMVAAANQPIERIVVSGSMQHVTVMQVEDVVRAELHGAGLVTVNLGRISRALDALPWVDRAHVSLRWPRGLAIQIDEQVAVARWNGAGLLNARGELFLPATTLARPDLPRLSGPEGAEQEVTARYLQMQQRLQPLGLALTALALDERGAWNFTLADAVTVRLGRSNVDARFGRFVLAAAPLVRTRAADIGYVDMRYGNGFAVGWKGAHAPAVQPLARTGDHSHFNG